MNILCKPAHLSGALSAIDSKSDAHRILIAAALSDRPTFVGMDTRLSEDMEATVRCLTALGAQIEVESEGLRVTPIDHCPNCPTLDCGESGSTLRFLLPVVGALGCGAVFTGSGRLPYRPIGPLMEALTGGGLEVEYLGGEGASLPLRLTGRLNPMLYRLPGSISSQFITGLLLAFPRMGGGEIKLTDPLESSGYVDMTLHTLERFGVQVMAVDDYFSVEPDATYLSPGEIDVEGDWSNMAFFLAAGALMGPVVISGLDPQSRQGDRAVVPLLSRFGATADGQRITVRIERMGLRAVEIDLRETPDLAPILAMVAALSEGETLLTGGARLRIKESDRLSSVAAMLTALGGQVEEGPDYLRITGQPRLKGGEIDCAGDHRIVMAGAIAAACCEGDTLLRGAEAVHKSYPRFFEDYRRMGGIYHVV